jgi:crotonobetainyl-CoA:carnitine CoA-transferase CaiB-like acyl-CoA transferase
VRLDGERADSDLPPPSLGEHTAEIISSLGLSADEIASLQREGVIGC